MSSRPIEGLNQKSVPCRICGDATTMLGTKLCDRCWELESRIHGDHEIASRIFAAYPKFIGRDS